MTSNRIIPDRYYTCKHCDGSHPLGEVCVLKRLEAIQKSHQFLDNHFKSMNEHYAYVGKLKRSYDRRMKIKNLIIYVSLFVCIFLWCIL